MAGERNQEFGNGGPMNGNSTRFNGAVMCGAILLAWLPGARAMLTENRPSSIHEPAGSLHAAQLLHAAESTEAARWQEILVARRPARIAALCEAFQRDFPGSAMREEARRIAAGAARAGSVQADVGLSGDFFDTAKGNATLSASLMGAARGSAGAAYDVAQAYAKGSQGVFASLYRQEQWLRFAAELGHARASWELAELYNGYGRVGDAAHYERRAVALGYKPPLRLPTRDY